ncbi:MAG TPA: UDP-3-O-(3-hydroxymyristoyl)glucosamine N-acyltransferase [Wenzhouxiangellaceae bacterium]|nr:UDP-3-O-(3-hydroxymyristoyl)glucosamine N-acyltransferase [Wenzhouxiangellaceae bacterium]
MRRQASSVTAPVSLGDLAAALDLELRGDPEILVHAGATLVTATPGQISFLANSAYRSRLSATRASAVVLTGSAAEDCPCAALVSDEPYAAWARVLQRLHPAPGVRPGIHASAQVDDSAEIDPGAEIGPLTHVAAGARVGAGAVLGPGCIVGENAVIGACARLVGNVFVGAACRLGQRVVVHPGAVIGADGFGLAMHRGSWINVPQIGAVRIGDDCEIGANTTIDRGAVEDTVLGCDVRLDNQVQVAHNVVIGDHTAIAGCVGIAGSTRIGKYCMIAGACGIGGHLEICDHVVITAMSTVLDSISEPGQYGSGIPARPLRAWQRILVRLGQLDRLFRKDTKQH